MRDRPNATLFIQSSLRDMQLHQTKIEPNIPYTQSLHLNKVYL
jgi:hypothetical protein